MSIHSLNSGKSGTYSSGTYSGKSGTYASGTYSEMSKEARDDLFDSVLPFVEKPARYCGGEWNAADKTGDVISSNLTRFAFCFPDIYEVGMSHIGLRILYDEINKRPDAFCERVFAPWTDMERMMRARGIPLFGIESRDAVAGFDFLGFTLQYELCYANVLNMLDLAGLSPVAAERGDSRPIVIAGGPCVCNPAPMAKFIDLFTPGEGEEVVHELLDLYSRMKTGANNGIKREFLYEAAKLDGVYVPTFPPSNGGQVKKRIIKDMNAQSYPTRGIVPNTAIIHDRIVLELARGCIRGCRFCQAGYLYRPVREKDPEVLRGQAEALIESTGYEEISMSSLSAGDYTGLCEFTASFGPRLEDRRVNLSMPSLRVDSFSPQLAKSASNVRRSGLTFAPEAGTQRLRDVINKNITEAEILETAALAFDSGWSGVKLYFMIGLPTETREDLEGIVALVRKIIGQYRDASRERRAKDLNINVSLASFIPKPFTPFQWEAQDSVDELRRKQAYLKDALRMKHVKLSWHEAGESFIEAVFARGGEQAGEALYEAWKAGAKFDGWDDLFNFNLWINAFEKAGVDPAVIANRKYGFNEPLPWDVMDYGVAKDFLKAEMARARDGVTTANCREACAGCGIARDYGCASSGRGGSAPQC